MIRWKIGHTICGIDELPNHRARGVTHLLSILDPDYPDPLTDYPAHQRLTLRFHDAVGPGPGLVPPNREHVEELLAFGRTLPGGDPSHLLVHCHAGVSRSTAAMAGLLLQAHPEASEDALLRHISLIRRQAWPNSIMIGHVDDILGREGRLVTALRRFYGRKLRTSPELEEELRSFGRGAEIDMAL
jgi:predicted protein tyrosine phosphatase